MPVKKRISKAKPYYSETIERLIGCLDIEFSELAKDDLVAVVYFNEFPEFPEKVRSRAMSILTDWSILNADKAQGSKRPNSTTSYPRIASSRRDRVSQW